MSARPFHKRYHSDALAGFMALTLEERGAYQTLLDLMYDRGGPIPDNERLLAGYMGVSLRKWKSLRDDLIAKGKIKVTSDGHLSNFRVEKELENDAKTARKHAENGLKGARKKYENEKTANENNKGDVARLEPGDGLNHIPDTRDHIEEEERAGAKFDDRYAFCGKVIRLNQADLDKWRTTFHAIPDIVAELEGFDDWWTRQPPEERADWFSRTKRNLNRSHQKFLGERKPGGGSAAPADFSDFLTERNRQRDEFERRQREGVK